MTDARRLITMWVCVACAVAACNGRDYVDDPSMPNLEPGRLTQPASLSPAAQSREQPVTLDAAVDELSKREYAGTTYPERTNVTLADVRQWSLEHNLDVRVQQYNPTLGVTALDEELAKFEAVLTANYTRNDNTLVENLEAGTSTASDSGQVNIDFPLATGGTVSVGTIFNKADDVLSSEPWEAGFQVDLSMPILRGFGMRVNTASIRIASMTSQQVDARTLLEVIRILSNAEKAYWQLYAARRILEVRERQHRLAEEQLARARRRVEAGELASIEVLRAQSGIGRTIEQLIVADNQLRLRARALKRFMNAPELPVDGPTMLDPTTASQPMGLDLDAKKLTDMALANRMELLDLELQLAIDAERVAIARNDALPLFTLDYQYQVFGDASGLASAYGSLGDYDPFILSLNASIPLGNEARRSKVSDAIARRLQRLATKEARTQSITQEVHDVVDTVRTAWRRVVAARLEAQLAERTMQAEQRQFDVGLRTSVDVLDATARFADAQAREVEAAATYESSLVDLAFATGTVLGEAQVTMPGPMPVPDPDRRTFGEP